MQRAFLTIFLFPVLLFGYCPEQELGPLFRAVQMQNVFADSKTFVDCNPRCSPQAILEIYEQERPQNLAAFVSTYFEMPEICSQPPLVGLSMEEYIEKTWSSLLRCSLGACCETTTLLPMPSTYVVAGERFREMYYWDSYFSMLGLLLSGRCDLVDGMLKDFTYLIDTYGFIPNGNRSYYLTRSQPPFFSLMVQLTSCQGRFIPQLEKEYSFWMKERLAPSGVLNHYSDAAYTPRPEGYREDVLDAEKLPESERAEFYHNVRATAESGWDFSSRWLNQKGELVTTDILPVDLNCLLYHEEKLLGQLYATQGCEEIACEYQERAAKRKKAIETTFWNQEKGYYFDYNDTDKKQTGHYTLAGVFPLLFQLASNAQAERVAKTLEEKFLKPGGLVTTLVESGQQWDYPNGWAPLQWAAVVGLRNYGYDDLAEQIIQNWLKGIRHLYEKTGLMFEKYNVVDLSLEASGGEYSLQAGFGWTNGVALYFLNIPPFKE